MCADCPTRILPCLPRNVKLCPVRQTVKRQTQKESGVLLFEESFSHLGA